MDQANVLPTPMVTNLSFSSPQGTSIPNPQEYRSIVGTCSMYVTITRPDIAFSVNKVSQFMHCPTDVHFKLPKRILRVPQRHFTIWHDQQSPHLSTVGFSNVDWDSDSDGRRIMTRDCIFVDCNAVAWSSKKQQTVCRSNTESKYRSLANATAEVIWIQSLLCELRIPLVREPLIWCDNISTVALSADLVFHSRSKHF